MKNKRELFSKAVKSINDEDFQSIISITELFDIRGRRVFGIRTINTHHRGQDMILYLESLKALKNLIEDVVSHVEGK